MNPTWYIIAITNAAMAGSNGYFYAQGAGFKHALVALFCAICAVISFKQTRNIL